MKKSFLAITLAVVLIFAFAACSSQGDDKVTDEVTINGEKTTSISEITVADGVEIDTKQSAFVIPKGTVTHVDDYSISYSLTPSAHEDAILFYEKLAADLKAEGSPIATEADDPSLEFWEYNGSYEGKAMFGVDEIRTLAITIVSSPDMTSVLVNY